MSDCPHGKGMDTACTECSAALITEALGHPRVVLIKEENFAAEVQSLYNALTHSIQEWKAIHPEVRADGTIQLIAVTLLAKIVLELLVKQSEALREDSATMNEVWESVKSKVMIAVRMQEDDDLRRM